PELPRSAAGDGDDRRRRRRPFARRGRGEPRAGLAQPHRAPRGGPGGKPVRQVHPHARLTKLNGWRVPRAWSPRFQRGLHPRPRLMAPTWARPPGQDPGRHPMKRIALLFLIALFAAGTLSACNTVAGAGKDVQKVGEKVEEAADDTGGTDPR